MAEVTMAALVAGVRSGRWLIGFPTDTVPALASRPDQAELIFTAKQRQPDKPLILMAATPKALWPYVQGTAQEFQIWQEVAQTYWPGALTLVLPASDRLPPAMNPLDGKTIGIRVPRWAIAQTLLEQTGPLATTSINRSGQPPLLTLTEIRSAFPQVLTLPQSDWQLPASQSGVAGSTAGIPSTVAQWTGSGWKILRQGAVQIS